MNAGHMQWSEIMPFLYHVSIHISTIHIHVINASVCVNTYQLYQRDMFLFRIRQTNQAGHSNREWNLLETNLCGYNRRLSLSLSLSLHLFSLFLFIDTNI